jgi:hypothetical protein
VGRDFRSISTNVLDHARRGQPGGGEAISPETMNVVGLVLREDKKIVDKITKGARMHARIWMVTTRPSPRSP